MLGKFQYWVDDRVQRTVSLPEIINHRSQTFCRSRYQKSFYHLRFCLISLLFAISPLQAGVSFLYPLKTLENFSSVMEEFMLDSKVKSHFINVTAMRTPMYIEFRPYAHKAIQENAGKKTTDFLCSYFFTHECFSRNK